MDDLQKQLDDEFDELQKQLAMMQDQHEFGEGDLDDDLTQLQRQLEDDDEFEVQTEEGFPKAFAANTILVIDNILGAYDETIKTQEQYYANRCKDAKTDDEKLEIKYDKEAQISKLKKYFVQVLEKKKYMLKEIKEGKISSQAYVNRLNSYNVQDIVNKFLRGQIEKERILLTKFGSPEVFFQKIGAKFQKSLEGQEEKIDTKKKKVGEKAKEKKEVKAKVVEEEKPPAPVVKQLTQEEKQEEAAKKMDNLNISKKLQFVLKSNYRTESYLEYFLKNLEKTQAKTRSIELLPILKKCKEIIGNLSKNIDVPVGAFLVKEVPKMTFEKFHNMTKKEYIGLIEGMVSQLKVLIKSQDNFRKKCSETVEEGTQSPLKYSQKNKLVYEQYISYLNALKLKQFCPLPRILTKQVQRIAFIENLSIPKNQLHLKINRIDGIGSKCTMKVYLPQQQQDSVYATEVSEGDQKISIAIKLKDELLKDLTRLDLKIKFSQSKMVFFKSDIGEVVMNTKDLQYKNYLQLVVQKDKISVKYQILTRYPRNKATKTKMQEATLVKVNEYVYDAHKEVQFIRKYIRDYNPPKQARTLTLFYVERTEELHAKIKGLEVEGLSQNEVVEPEANCSSLEYIAEMDKVIDKALNVIYSFKQNRKILERIQDSLMGKSNLLKQQFQNRKITKRQYSKKLEEDAQRDQKLIKLYERQGLTKMAEFIGFRLKIIQQELQNVLFQAKLEEEKKQEEAKKEAEKEKQLEREREKEKEKEKEVIQQQQPKIQTEEQANISTQPVAQPSSITMISQDPKLSQKPLDIKQPWLPEYCKCLTYLQKMCQIVSDQALNKQFNRVKDEFMSSFQSGEIDADIYQANLKTYLQADRNRLAIYLVEEVPEYSKFISQRIKIIQEELANF